MKQKRIKSVVMAVLITVPILIAKINISKPKPESGVRNVSTHEADLMIAKTLLTPGFLNIMLL